MLRSFPWNTIVNLHAYDSDLLAKKRVPCSLLRAAPVAQPFKFRSGAACYAVLSPQALLPSPPSNTSPSRGSPACSFLWLPSFVRPARPVFPHHITYLDAGRHQLLVSRRVLLKGLTILQNFQVVDYRRHTYRRFKAT